MNIILIRHQAGDKLEIPFHKRSIEEIRQQPADEFEMPEVIYYLFSFYLMLGMYSGFSIFVISPTAKPPGNLTVPLSIMRRS